MGVVAEQAAIEENTVEAVQSSQAVRFDNQHTGSRKPVPKVRGKGIATVARRFWHPCENWRGRTLNIAQRQQGRKKYSDGRHRCLVGIGLDGAFGRRAWTLARHLGRGRKGLGSRTQHRFQGLPQRAPGKEFSQGQAAPQRRHHGPHLAVKQRLYDRSRDLERKLGTGDGPHALKRLAHLRHAGRKLQEGSQIDGDGTGLGTESAQHGAGAHARDIDGNLDAGAGQRKGVARVTLRMSLRYRSADMRGCALGLFQRMNEPTGIQPGPIALHDNATQTGIDPSPHHVGQLFQCTFKAFSGRLRIGALRGMQSQVHAPLLFPNHFGLYPMARKF